MTLFQAKDIQTIPGWVRSTHRLIVAYSSPMLRIDPFDVYSIINGTIRLDGGAMFGVVPKVLWAKTTDVDELNRISLATRTLLAVDRDSRRVVLVDTGCGTKWAPDQAQRFAICPDHEAIPSALSKIGLSAEDVTDIVVTHLHFDHNGGLTDWYDDPGGRTALKYPQARHWIHRGHWEHALAPTPKDRASFLREDFVALEDAGVIEWVDGDSPVSPFLGLEWFVSHGHTPYQLHPILGCDDPRLLFVGDLAPTLAHLRIGWVMAYDLHPLVTLQEKETIYRRCFDEGMTLAFPHDPKVGGVAIDGTVERPVVSKKLDV